MSSKNQLPKLPILELRPESPLHIPTVFLQFHIFPFIIEFFPPADANFNLNLVFLKIHLQWNQTQPPFPGFSIEPLDFPLVQQELPDPQWIVIIAIPMGIGADMQIVKINFFIFDQGIAILQIGTPLPQGLYLCAHKNDTCLQCVINEIIQPGGLVLTDYFFG